MRIGPAYDLAGTRLQDLDIGCPHCGKRLAEVLDDTTMQWNAGQVVCVDEGIAVRLPWVIRASWRAPGRHIAACQLCSHTTMPTTLENAVRFAAQHLERSHGDAA